MLEALVGKTLEQACLEATEEEELAELRKQYQMFIEVRDAELVEAERLEERDRRVRLV